MTKSNDEAHNKAKSMSMKYMQNIEKNMNYRIFELFISCCLISDIAY